MLVGNKCDESAALREVTELEGKAEASTWGVSFMETSAKNNINVTELFQVNSILHFAVVRWGSLFGMPTGKLRVKDKRKSKIKTKKATEWQEQQQQQQQQPER